MSMCGSVAITSLSIASKSYRLCQIIPMKTEGSILAAQALMRAKFPFWSGKKRAFPVGYSGDLWLPRWASGFAIDANFPLDLAF